MKKVLKIGAVVALAAVGLGLGRLLAAKLLPMIPPVAKMSAKAQEFIFDCVAVVGGIVGGVVGTKLARKIGLGAGPGVSVTK
jgi:hypothetical protein